MPHSSFSRHFSAIRPTLPFLGGVVLGLLPLFLFLLTFVYIYPIYPRHLILQHLNFNFCFARAGRIPSAVYLADRGALAFPLYASEAVSAVIVLLINGFSWKSKKMGVFATCLLTTLVFDFFVFWWIILSALEQCGGLS